MEKQVSLIEAVIVERNTDPVKTSISSDDQLAKAERHLLAALRSLKMANEEQQEELNYGKD